MRVGRTVVFVGRHIPQYYRVPKSGNSTTDNVNCIYRIAIFRFVVFYPAWYCGTFSGRLLFPKGNSSILSMAIGKSGQGDSDMFCNAQPCLRMK